MTTFLDCWTGVAAALLQQAVAGEPELVDSLPKPLESDSFGFTATIGGEEEGQFSVVLDGGVLDVPLLGEGMNQRAAWAELLREVCEAAVGEWLAKTGRVCRVEKFESATAMSSASRVFQLRSGERGWLILVRDEVHASKPAARTGTGSGAEEHRSLQGPGGEEPTQTSTGLQLLLDVELEATLRFGCRAMPLGEMLELGPGDVVQLDRQVSDRVDLIVADKIVARGQVVLVNGNFGLRVTEVEAPRRRLETIRCLF